MHTLKTQIARLWGDALHRNSFYLVAANALMGVLGFFYWFITARLYNAENVGLATAAFSLATLLANLSTLGLRVGLIHYLPSSQDKNRLLNTVLNLSIVICTVFALVTLLLLDVFSPKLLILRTSLPFLISFIPFVILSGVSNIVEGIFLVYRSGEYLLVEAGVLFGVKLILPIAFVVFATFGIFLSWYIGLIVAESVCILVLMRKFDYKPMLLIDVAIVRNIARFSFWSQITNFLSSLPVILIPIVITNLLRQRDAAYFYIDIMIANMFYIIAVAMSQSLFVEGSYDKSSLGVNLRKAAQIILAILVPGIIGVLLFGNLLLSFFGADYAREGTSLLILLVIAAIPTSINYIAQSVLTVNHRQRTAATINLLTVVMVVCLSYAFADKGLIGMGYAWLITYCVAALLYTSTIPKSIYAIVWQRLFHKPAEQP